MYIPLKIELLEFAGLRPSLEAMRIPKMSIGDTVWGNKCLGVQDKALARKLILAGNDHAKFVRGVVVYLRLRLQVGWMIQFETYRHGVECLSTSSTMHGELKELSGPVLAEQKQAELPNKVYDRRVMLSYQVLRSIYLARRNHRHPDWQIFCAFIEALPYFNDLIMPIVKRKDLK